MVIDVPIMFYDGESPDDPGQGAAAAILLMPNGKRFTVSQLLPTVTTQEAEYRGLIIGLEKAKKLGIRQLEIKGDSETVFNQINGLTQVSPDPLKPLHFEARKLMRSFEKVSVEYISHEQNRSARAAVRRCIGEALGRETPKTVTPVQPHLLPAIAEMVELGDKATEADYRSLILEQLDEYKLKSLAELRTFIPTEVQDTIALQWNGKEEELAEMYRWYLRGLPPDMAIKKVKIDYQDEIEPILEKLPWEEGLLVSSSHLFPEDEAEELPPLGEVISLETENLAKNLTQQPPLEPIDPKIQETFLSLAALATSPPLEDSDNIILSEPHLEVISGSRPQTENGKDTLPSHTRVSNVIELIERLSSSEKQVLTQELVKYPEMVNLILKAIADNVTKGQ